MIRPFRFPYNAVGPSFFCKRLFVLFLSVLPFLLTAQTIPLKGKITTSNKEPLPLAHILILPDSIMAPSDTEGVFAVELPPGPKVIRVTYTGFKVYQEAMILRKDTFLTISLQPKIGLLKEVSVLGNAGGQENLVQSLRTSTIAISKKDITGIPLLGGEADAIKTLQLLPGMQRGVEGSSDLFVRGGAADQNLILLDGATIYNSSHLLGFLSVFNPDILQNVEAINGGFPAEYGGRLSSILDITTNQTIAPETKVTGNVGLIASRLYVEQPLVKNKLSVWVAGRRTYIDQVFQLFGETLPYYFYDLNGKIIYKPGQSHQIEIGHFQGKDNFYLSQEEDEQRYGYTSAFTIDNSTQFVNWNHRIRNGWNSNLHLSRTSFQYNLNNSFGINSLVASSEIEDYSAKFTLEKNLEKKDSRIISGVEWTRHRVSPNVLNSSGFFSDYIESSEAAGQAVHEMAAFLQKDWSFGGRWLMSTGVRGSMAHLSNRSYFTPEPRFALRYSVQENQSIKLSYSRMAQYIHRISSSAISAPTDIWYPVTESVEPQRAHQVAAAWQTFLQEREVLLSAEVYYKTMNNLIGFEEGTNLFFNPDFKADLIQGRGRAYGLELLARKRSGKLSGWLSYTLSWSWRQYDEINEGLWFPARYDRRHNGAVVLQYELHDRWSASMVWEFISGSRFTPVVGHYFVPSPSYIGVDVIPQFSKINGVKLADTHRLDLGLKFRSKQQNKFGWHFSAGVNNVYNRASPVGIFIEENEEDGSLSYTQPGLFGLLPYFSFGFNF